ncbi:MAG: hypothetical protein P8080_03235 [Gammaproteobacteria bacterium]
MTGIIVGVVWLLAAVGVVVSALIKTVQLLNTGHGARAAAAFGIFMVWVLVSVVAVFFLQMFGAASVAAAHGHEAQAASPASDFARALVIGYPLVALVLLGILRLLAPPPGVSRSREPEQ